MRYHSTCTPVRNVNSVEVDFFGDARIFLWLRATTTPVPEWPQPALVSERSEAGCSKLSVNKQIDEK